MAERRVNIKKNLLLGITALCPFYAIADSQISKPIQTFEPDWYVGAKIGWEVYNRGCEEWATDCDDNSPAGGLFGGYNFNSRLGAELGYTYLGKAIATYSSGEVTGVMSSVDLFLRLNMPLTERVSLFGKVGGIYWQAENDHVYGKVKSDGGTAAVAAGLGYQISQHWVTQLEYQYAPNLGDTTVGGSNHHLLSLGLLYQFGSATETIEYVAQSQTNQETAVFQSRISDSLFAFDSARIENTTVLVPYVSRLKENPESEVVVVGHTDNKGSREYNDKLSLERAEAVKAYFVSQDIDSGRVHAYGLGKSAPIASNDTAEGRAKNRRVEISSPGFETNLIHNHSSSN